MAISKESKRKQSDVFKRGFKADAEKYAEFYRNELAISLSEPLPCFDLAKHLKLEIITLHQLPGANQNYINALLYTELSNQWSGFFIRLNGDNLIVYNCSHSPTRISSTIMHECAHAILKHPMAPIDLNSKIPRNEYPKEQEAEAEWLSGCLLLPKPALMKHYIYNKKSPDQIAQYFEVSNQMVNYRLQVSGTIAIHKRMGR